LESDPLAGRRADVERVDQTGSDGCTDAAEDHHRDEMPEHGYEYSRGDSPNNATEEERSEGISSCQGCTGRSSLQVTDSAFCGRDVVDDLEVDGEIVE
jgi:hypothetical protein